METGSLAGHVHFALFAQKLGGQASEMHSAGDVSSGAQFATDGQKEFGQARGLRIRLPMSSDSDPCERGASRSFRRYCPVILIFASLTISAHRGI
jgi:hypothetical protein